MKRNRNEYMKSYYAKRKAEGNTEVYKMTPEKRAKKRETYQANKLDKYIVYLLPSLDYVGITNNPKNRMKCHRHAGRSTNEWRVLHYANTRKEAAKIETLYVDMYGYVNKYKDIIK